MKKIKEFVKQYMIGLILSFLVCVVTVSAVTYFPSNQTTIETTMLLIQCLIVSYL